MQYYLKLHKKNELKPWHYSHETQVQVLPILKLRSWANIVF